MDRFFPLIIYKNYTLKSGKVVYHIIDQRDIRVIYLYRYENVFQRALIHP